jgi:hypothetical protein
MAHGTTRKFTRAATLSLLVFATGAGVAGMEVLAASPAMAQPDQGSPQSSPFAPSQEQQPGDPAQQGSPAQQGGGSTPGDGQQQPSNPADGAPGGLGGLLSGITGGGSGH